MSEFPADGVVDVEGEVADGVVGVKGEAADGDGGE